MQAIAEAELDHQRAIDRAVDLRQTGAPPDSVVQAFASARQPRARLLEAAAEFESATEARLRRDTEAATEATFQAITYLAALTVAFIAASALTAVMLTRRLGRQVGTAVNQIRSSSSELEAAARQQAGGVREQATAMSQISTTISELLATSRQIAESAGHVARMAEGMATSAQAGSRTVADAHAAAADMRRQMAQVVKHMRDLGRKSQQIGAVTAIVGDLAEQTNILAINASIEAAGAGEAGRRFAIVADEIRKLADRVGTSTKEIRDLIDDVRSAAHTTVTATENGSGAVAAGTRLFDQVEASFATIVDLVATTTEAAREIQLSTKQQASAVEQVNAATGSVAQALRESDAASHQTQQTASELANLSGALTRLVRTPAAA